MKPPLPVQKSCLDPAAAVDLFAKVVVATCPACGRPSRMKALAIPTNAVTRTQLTCSCRSAFLVEFTAEQVNAVHPRQEAPAPPAPVAAPERPTGSKPSAARAEPGHGCLVVGCGRRVRWLPRLRGWKRDRGLWFCPAHSDYTADRAMTEFAIASAAALAWRPGPARTSPSRTGDAGAAGADPAAVPEPVVPAASTPGEQLLDAAGRGDAETVRRLLREHAFDRGPLGNALVRSTWDRGSVETARVLIRAGADVGNAEEWGAVALSAAVGKAQYEMLELLVASGADPTREDRPDHSPLEKAVSRRDDRALEILGAARPTGMNAGTLTGAARYGAVELARRALEAGVPVDARDGYGSPALLVAAQAGHADVVRLLLDRGADPNSVSGRGAETALTAAVCGGSAEVVRALIVAGADVDTRRTFDNGTPRSVAEWLGRSEIYRILVEAGAR